MLQVKLLRAPGEMYIPEYEADVEALLALLHQTKEELGIKSITHHEDGPLIEIIKVVLPLIIPAVVGVFKAWLKYRAGRSARVIKQRNGAVMIDTRGYSIDEVQNLLQQAANDP